MIKIWLIEIDKEADDKFVMFEQIQEISNFCVSDFEKLTHKMI